MNEIFFQEYLDQLDLKNIRKYCKNCEENDQCSEEIGSDHPLVRFQECELLQELF